MNPSPMSSAIDPDDNDMNLVEIWLRKDPPRWIAGVLAGLLAGAVAMAVAGLISRAAGFQMLFPLKLMATPFCGPAATDLDAGIGTVLVGLALIETICAFWGFVFAHFTGTNSLSALLAMGIVWAAFSWVFLWNLFFQSWKPIFAAQIPAGVVFPVCLAYGISLCSVAFFDRMIRS